MEEFSFKEETYKIIGACFNVYNTIGTGFLESVYQECLTIEFDKQIIPYVQQKELGIYYDGILLSQKFKADFVCYDSIIIELKAVKSLSNEHKAQLINYLHITNLKVGLLINFGSFPKLQYERLVI